ncbi:hypothetical protein ACHAXH_005852 [Discostella pseudostelligera]|jgi:RNA-binding motif X-linked protein 2
MNVINEILRINNLELEKGLTYTSGSWHNQYRNSSWVYIGNLPLNLTEGDVICILSQYGEIDDIHLVRDSDSGKSKGFAFVKYTDARSAVLAVDNFTGSMVLGRTLRVDHVENYRLPKHVREKEEKEREEMKLKGGKGEDDSDNDSSDDDYDDDRGEKKVGDSRHGVAESGHAYKGQELASSFDIHSGQDLFARPPQTSQKTEREDNTHNADIENNGGGKSEKEERRRRKEERARKRKEKEAHRQMKEERKRRKKKH